MNGHGDGYDYAPMPADDDDGPVQTDIECPFCGHYVEWLPPVLYCDNCEVTWNNAAEVEADCQDLADAEDAEMYRSTSMDMGRWR